MKHYANYMITVVLLMYGLVYTLSSCNRDDIPGGGENPELPPESEKVVINFTVSSSDFDDAILPGEEVSPKSSPNPSGGAKGNLFKETAVVRVSEDITMYATLKEDETPVKLRAGGDLVRLTSGSQVCVVAYHIFAGDTTYYGHAFYSAVDALIGSFLSSGSPLTVLPEMEYRFVAFSYDDASPMNYSDPIAGISPSTPVIWGDTIATVSPSSFNLHITMHHLTSKVSLTVNSLPTGLLINEIHSIDAARIHAAIPELNVKEGELDEVNTGYGSFSFVPGISVSKTSAPLYPLPVSGASITELEIDSLWINGLLYRNVSPNSVGPFKVVYSKPIEVGKAYTLQVYLRYSLGGSADRITLYEGSSTGAMLAITNDPNDPGLFFKFGGVVGVNADLGGGSFNPFSDIYYNPTLASYAQFQFIPGYEPADLVNNISVNAYHNLDNIKNGKGDPCRLIGIADDEFLGFADDAALYAREAELKAEGVGGWRMPTPMENLRFSGLPNSSQTYSAHWWGLSPPFISPYGFPPVAGGEFPARNSSWPDGHKFLPRTGYLSNDGSHITFNGFSYYLSSEPGPDDYGLDFMFDNGSVDPIINIPVNFGRSVRCVRDESPITIEVEDWIYGGPIGGPGGEGEIVLP